MGSAKCTNTRCLVVQVPSRAVAGADTGSHSSVGHTDGFDGLILILILSLEVEVKWKCLE